MESMEPSAKCSSTQAVSMLNSQLRILFMHVIASVLLDMGLGKTVISLTAIADLLFDSFEVHRILVIAPLRVARDRITQAAEQALWRKYRVYL